MPLFRSRVVRLSAAGLERLSALWYSAAWLMSDLPEKTGQLLTDMGPILCRKIGRRDTLRVSNPFYPLPHSLSRQWAIIKPQPILADLALQLDQASEPGRNDGTKTGKRQQGRTAVHNVTIRQARSEERRGGQEWGIPFK